MPWYWSDDIAKIMAEAQRLDGKTAENLVATPVAFRSPASTIEEALELLQDEDEVPLAA